MSHVFDWVADYNFPCFESPKTGYTHTKERKNKQTKQNETKPNDNQSRDTQQRFLMCNTEVFHQCFANNTIDYNTVPPE